MTHFTASNLARHLAGIGASTDGADDLFKALSAAYAAPSRFYHSVSHIDACLGALDTYSSLAERPDEIAVALWFHDAVYDARRHDNEEASAKWASDALPTLGVPGDAVARIDAMIIATKTHDANDADTVLLVDIDLGILGAAPSVYRRYTEGVRQEYDFVPLADYRLGRARVLEHFLERPEIYKTAPFQLELEARARQNIAEELTALRNG